MIVYFIVSSVVLIIWLIISNDSYTVSLPLIISLIAILLSHHLFGIIFKLYKKVWEYASTGELLIILKVVSYSRSEEHTSELQSRGQLVCRLLLGTRYS